MSLDLLAVVCLLYVSLLFLAAFAAERRAAAGKSGWLRSPAVYTLSLSIYCTAWTFYGAVGYAARSGLEFVTIYLGPTLVMVGWLLFARKLVRVGRGLRITSIADLVSSRYGKSTPLGMIVALLAVVGITPYIALQLQSVALSFSVFSASDAPVWGDRLPESTALAVAAGLALFAILFGTRSLDVDERHHGVVAAVALEAVVKLLALLAVGAFVVWGAAGGPGDMMDRIEASEIGVWRIDGARWITLTFLAGAAFLCLPRMFQVMVVENADERQLATASWAFPLYLFAMSLFVVPIAVVGLETMPEGSNPDLYVLTVPLSLDRDGLAMLAFLGGFSSATSMVIVAAIALSTMVSNHVVMPIWLAWRKGAAKLSGDVRAVGLLSRRLSIGGTLLLGYLYLVFSGGGEALAAIGLISFAGIAQVLPALAGGLFWRGATRIGAATGLSAGFAVWAWTLFLPSFSGSFLMPAEAIADGPWGIGWLRPYALFGVDGLDRVVHSVFWSMAFNASAFVLGSLSSSPRPLERLQGDRFVDAPDLPRGAAGWSPGAAGAEDLLAMAQRILGPSEAQELFHASAREQGRAGYLPEATPEFVERLERELAGSVGAATAHAMVGRIAGGAGVTVEDLMAVADETAQMLEHSSQLEQKSDELARTARQLRDANDKLTRLSAQKDAFLGQISHELRTPMTSIRAFSEILMGDGPMEAGEQKRFSRIIHDEAIRLTRLLDDLLELNVLESGKAPLGREAGNLRATIERAVSATRSPEGRGGLTILRDAAAEDVPLATDCDRLAQVFINLISNARKYCDSEDPVLKIDTRRVDGAVHVDFVDNGSGIPEAGQTVIFEKFARFGDHGRAGGAGLGLAICREIMGRLGGSVSYLPGQGGAAFRVTLPLDGAAVASPGEPRRAAGGRG